VLPPLVLPPQQNLLLPLLMRAMHAALARVPPAAPATPRAPHAQARPAHATTRAPAVVATPGEPLPARLPAQQGNAPKRAKLM
jgi:hypothetical protein